MSFTSLDPTTHVPSWKIWETGISPSFALEVVSKDWEKVYAQAPTAYEQGEGAYGAPVGGRGPSATSPGYALPPLTPAVRRTTLLPHADVQSLR